MKRRPLRSTSTDNLCPSSTVFRSVGYHVLRRLPYGIGRARVGDDGAFDVDRVLDRLAVLRLRLAHLRGGPATLEQRDRERHAPRHPEARILRRPRAIPRRGAEIIEIVAARDDADRRQPLALGDAHVRSEEHTSELQSLMRISYAVFCLQK